MIKQCINIVQVVDSFRLTIGCYVYNPAVERILENTGGEVGTWVQINGIYRYRLFNDWSYLCLKDNPEKRIMSCLNDSNLMMKGNVVKYFALMLSFIVWYILLFAIVGFVATIFSEHALKGVNLIIGIGFTF